jgi:hypothetical protein
MDYLEQNKLILDESKKKYPTINDNITLLYLSGKPLSEICFLFKANLYPYIFTNLSNYIQWAETNNTIYERQNIIALTKLINLIEEEGNLPGYSIEKIVVKLPTLLVSVCLLEVLNQKYGKHMGLIYASLTAMTLRQPSLVYIYAHIAFNSGNFGKILKDICCEGSNVLCKYYLFCLKKAIHNEKRDFTEKERYFFRKYATMSFDEIIDYQQKIQFESVTLKRCPDFNHIIPNKSVHYLKIDLFENIFISDKEDILTKIYENLERFNNFIENLQFGSVQTIANISELNKHFLIEHKRFANTIIHFVLLNKTNKEEFSKIGIDFNSYVNEVNKQFDKSMHIEKFFKNFYELFDLSIHTLQNELFLNCLDLQENIFCYIISLINMLSNDDILPEYFIHMENKINEYPYNPIYEKIVGFFEIFNPDKNNSILIEKYPKCF